MAVDNVGPKPYVGVKTTPRIPGVGNTDKRSDKDRQTPRPRKKGDKSDDDKHGGIDERV